MGNALESLSPNRGVKRNREELEESREDNGNTTLETPRDFQTPKRKRTQSTAKYILKTLFEEGTESDIVINACGQEWRLHKLYLCQCRYFDSMFNGPWKEADQSVVNMEITDETINHKALKIAFQSLYTDNVFVKPADAVGVLAAATLLQLDPLIEHCKSVMKDSIAPDTVCNFYKAAERYGLVEVKDLCLKWLLQCLMVPGYATLICHIPEDLLVTLLTSHDLWLMQVEVDMYTLLKKWMFIQLNPSWNGGREQLHSDSEDYFNRKTKQDNDSCFLETESGQRFIHLFKRVRWMYVINDLSSIQLIKDDKIIPLAWLEPYFCYCWSHHLMIEQGVDKGPQTVTEEQFLQRSMRCGRILLQEQDYCWRWVGYNYGLDLLITCRNRVLVIKRNGGSQHFEGLISQQNQRHVMIRLSLTTIRKKEQNVPVNTTGIKTLTLCPDEEVMLMQLRSDVKFPLQVMMNLLFVSPCDTLPWPSLAVPPPPVVSIPSPSLSSISVSSSTTTVSSSTSMASVAVVAASREDDGKVTEDRQCSEEQNKQLHVSSEHCDSGTKLFRAQGEQSSDQASNDLCRRQASPSRVHNHAGHMSGGEMEFLRNQEASENNSNLDTSQLTLSRLGQHLESGSPHELPDPGGPFVSDVDVPAPRAVEDPPSLPASSVALVNGTSPAEGFCRSIQGRDPLRHFASCSASPASINSSAAVSALSLPCSTSSTRHSLRSGSRRKSSPE